MAKDKTFYERADPRLQALYIESALAVGLNPYPQYPRDLGDPVHPTCNCGECVAARRCNG